MSSKGKSTSSSSNEAKVAQILFSGGTYQVEVKGPKPKEVSWPFLQISDEGKVLDAFCTCGVTGTCVHLEAATERIFNGQEEPLHVRFQHSLWNQLCQMASRRHGYEPNVLKEDKKGNYSAHSATKKLLFELKPLNAVGKKKISEILKHRVVETEETSLKFSKLPPEELVLWRQGRPTHSLCYELSFWSDLAKWWMWLQESGEPYEITFVQEGQELPKSIKIHFNSVEMLFYIAEVNWSDIIPALSTVKSPLPLHEFQSERIEKILYKPLAKQFVIDFVPQSEEEKKEAPPENHISIGEWIFVPGRGFYPARLDPLLQKKNITKEHIAGVLQRHAKLIQKYLVGTKIHTDPIKAQYQLSFNGDDSLHISCYVFEVGDLQRLDSAYFGPWVYIQGKGFYCLENLLFEGVEKIITKDKVSDFVSMHRHWLHSFEGFQTHVSTIDSHLSYQVTQEEVLRFDTQLDMTDESEYVVDFGDWVYVKGRGFYSKLAGKVGMYLRRGMTVPAKEISPFIRMHQEELETIEHFFSSRCPVEKAGLNISLNANQEIVIAPVYSFSVPAEKVKVFGDYTYVIGEGFAEIPPEMRLPERFVREAVINPSQQPYFVAYELDSLKPFILSIDPHLCKPKHLLLAINEIKKSKSDGWIVELEYETELGRVDVVEIWQALNEKKKMVFSPAGLILLNQPRFNWLKNLSKTRWLAKGKKVRLTALEWIRLTVFEELKEPTETESRKVLDDFKTFQTVEPIDLSGLQSNLRPYQETGVRWLWFLYNQGLSGLLCDEMGLGKTHQAMALLAAAFNTNKEDPYLVVCPTSVIYHWQDLLKRFLPHLRVCVFYGIQRTLENFKDNYDLLLTSYGTMRSEKKALSDIRFGIAVFDEIQIAKNIHSQTHKALRTLDAKMRLGLTGTPIENRLLELKALFDVVIPSYMPQEAQFKELFVNPIEKSQDPDKKMLLSRLIKPFILRRKKAEVLLELPEKIEEIAYCPLSEEQKELYRNAFLTSKPLLEDLQDLRKPVPFVHVFSLLSTLKQICDHPCLVNKNTEDFHKHQSGKWDLFVELLAEIRDSGQKVVVFSQYLDMLNIIEAYLKEKKIGFAGIRGSTRNRKEQLDKFKDDPNCEVFVASLQAAGVGIDLISASVVIHYDRWWNPAKENQATDRVHRMGQRRGVQVFKMVTKGTIEEHIHKLIEKKLTLMEGIIGFDDQDQIKGLTREELSALLQLMHADLSEENP